MKLFNNRRYVILTIKQKEKAEVVKLAKDHGLGLMYPSIFLEEVNNLIQTCIDDECLGGHLMSMICAYEISYLRNKQYRIFKNVKELKKYVEIADKRQESYFVMEKDTEHYFSYVKSLSFDDLKTEYFLVKAIVDYTDSYYLATKNYVEKTLTNSIKRDIYKKEDSLDAVYKHLNKLVKLRNELDDVLNTEIYLINKDNCSKEPDSVSTAKNDNVSQMRMRSYLKRIHSYFHSSERSGFFYLNVIYKNIDTIFNVFNFKLKCEGTISYEHKALEGVRELGYQKHLPDYLVGNGKGKNWDYLSILKRLVYSLKVYDCYPLLSNSIIPLAYKNLEEIECLANKLIELGYRDLDDLVNCTKHKYRPIAVIIEPHKKIFRDGPSRTVMACMCSSRRRKPLYVNELLEHFEPIIINHDFVYHNLLLLQITKERKREMPKVLTLKEAEKVRGNKELEKLINMVKEATESKK